MMKFSKIIILPLFFFSCTKKQLPAPEPQNQSNAVIFELEVLRVMDDRLPGLNDEDMKEILAEAERILKAKLGNESKFKFKDNGTAAAKDFFSGRNYKNSNSYKENRNWKLNIQSNKKEIRKYLSQQKILKNTSHFLKDWSLDSLNQFFPGSKTYDQAAKNLNAVYSEKIEWLKSLKVEEKDSLVILPPEDFQSYVEWLTLMFEQNQYDIIFTNSLIINDYIASPYPHTISKHAKIGGSSFISPKRNAMAGASLLVSTLEDFGRIKGLSSPLEIERQERNRIIGGFLLAHEIGHAFYKIPDVYDHTDSCLMNSKWEKLNSVDGYRLLASDMSPCPYCKKWEQSKNLYIDGLEFQMKNDQLEAGKAFLKSAEILPERIDGDRKAYYNFLMTNAETALKKSGRDIQDFIRKESGTSEKN